MAVSILFELNQELTRLFVAGSRLSQGDPRLKKMIDPLKKYGEKAPVFLKLAQSIEELVASSAENSSQKLIEVKAFLLSVLSTQGETDIDVSQADLTYAQDTKPPLKTEIGYRALAPVIDALTQSGSGRLEIVKNAYDKGMFEDPRLYRAAVVSLGDKYPEMISYMMEKVLPSMGEAICPFLLEGYDLKGNIMDGRRLLVLHAIQGSKMLSLARTALAEGSVPVKTEAVKIAANYPEYEDILISMLQENKAVREEVMKALAAMDSKAGVDRLMDIYKGEKTKRDTVYDALAHGKSAYLSERLLTETKESTERVLDLIKPFLDAGKIVDEQVFEAIQKLNSDICLLRNKSTDAVGDFLKGLLQEEWIYKVNALLPKGKKQAYYAYNNIHLEDNALTSLYECRKGEDFIWKMFMDTQQRGIGKLLGKLSSKPTPKMPKELPVYAFKIGAKILDPEEFYDIFFASELYEEIYKYDHYAFQNIFLRAEDRPPLSRKVIRYFTKIRNKDYHRIYLALQLVEPEDTETLGLLAGYLRSHMEQSVRPYGAVDILRKLGETGYKEFQGLYELYQSKNPGAVRDLAELSSFLNR